eukprot:scaffold238242_cov33-Prasinocladus_malaysianus.AAC.1
MPKIHATSKWQRDRQAKQRRNKHTEKARNKPNVKKKGRCNFIKAKKGRKDILRFDISEFQSDSKSNTALLSDTHDTDGCVGAYLHGGSFRPEGCSRAKGHGRRDCLGHRLPQRPEDRCDPPAGVLAVRPDNGRLLEPPCSAPQQANRCAAQAGSLTAPRAPSALHNGIHISKVMQDFIKTP